MSNNVKEAEQKALEAKYRNHEELAQVKSALLQTQRELMMKKRNARLERTKLQMQLKKEREAERRKIAEEKKAYKAEIDKEKQLVRENVQAIALEHKRLKKDLSLRKQEQTKALFIAKTDNFNKFSNLKSELAFEKTKYKKKMMETKVESQTQLIEVKKLIRDSQDEAIKYKMEAEKMIANKKQELFDKKKELARKLNEIREKAEKERIARVVEQMKNQQELREAELKALTNHKRKILELQGKEVKQEEELIEEYKKANDEVVLEVKEMELIKQLEKTQNVEARFAKILANTQKDETPRHDSNVVVDMHTIEFKAIVGNEDLQGQIVSEVGKMGMSLYEKANRDTSKVNINKLQRSNFNPEILELIKEIQTGKVMKEMSDIREFTKYVSFMNDIEVSKDNFEKYLIANVASILKGKVLKFLNGYFHTTQIKGYTWIVFEEKLTVNHRQLISIQDTTFSHSLEELMIEKLKNGAIIQVTNNIALKLVDGTIKVLCDLPVLDI